MRRVTLLALLALLALLLPSRAHAAAIIAYGSANDTTCTATTSCNKLVVPSYTSPNASIVFCVNTSGGASVATGVTTPTIQGVSMTAWGSTITQDKNTTTCFHKAIVTGDAGQTISNVTWTHSNDAEVDEWLVYPSDNVAVTFGTPATHTCGPNVGTCTPSTVTPAQNGDLVFNMCNEGGGSPNWAPNSFGQFDTPFPSFHGQDVLMGMLGWNKSSGSPTMTAVQDTVGGNIYSYTCFTGDITASGSGSVIVGAGREGYNTGVFSMSTNVSAYAQSSDVEFAGVATIGTAQTVYPMPQTGASVSTLAFSAKSATGSFTINAGASVGDLMVTCAYSGSTLTAPSGLNSTPICANQVAFPSACEYKVLVSGDIGHTYTWTGGSPNVFYTDWHNTSGTAWAIDPGSSCGSVGSGTTANAPALTTLSNDEMVLVATNQGGSFTVTKPAGTTLALSAGAPNNNTAGYVNEASPGSIGTQTFSSTGSQSWEVESIGIIRLTGTSTWTAIASTHNDAGTVQMNTFWNTGLAASSTQTFLTTPATSLDAVIVNVGNLNTTTPVGGTAGTLQLEGQSKDQIAPVTLSTVNDDLALSFTGFVTGGPGAPQANEVPQNVSTGTQLSVYYEGVDFAEAAQLAGSAIQAFASVTIPLQAASAPAQTSSAIRLQQQIEEIFSLAPAPTPPTQPSQSYQDFISRNDSDWILANAQ